MTRYSVLISLLFMSLSVAFAQESGGDEREYSVLMQARGREMSGICMMQTAPDGSVAGTLLTEFGVKIFDFTYYNGKAKVVNVIAPMNKWYIRKVLKKDMKFMVESLEQGAGDTEQRTGSLEKGARSFSCEADGSFKVSNNKYKIYYTFSPLNILQ